MALEELFPNTDPFSRVAASTTSVDWNHVKTLPFERLRRPWDSDTLVPPEKRGSIARSAQEDAQENPIEKSDKKRRQLSPPPGGGILRRSPPLDKSVAAASDDTVEVSEGSPNSPKPLLKLFNYDCAKPGRAEDLMRRASTCELESQCDSQLGSQSLDTDTQLDVDHEDSDLARSRLAPDIGTDTQLDSDIENF